MILSRQGCFETFFYRPRSFTVLEMLQINLGMLFLVVKPNLDAAFHPFRPACERVLPFLVSLSLKLQWRLLVFFTPLRMFLIADTL